MHAIIASKLNKTEQAYAFYWTSRLDLDVNAEVEEGLHITSMAGTWMSIVEGFAGMRVKEEDYHFNIICRRLAKSAFQNQLRTRELHLGRGSLVYS